MAPDIRGACRSERSRGTFITFMVRPSADLFLETTDLPCWRHGEWLHLCSIALSAEPSRTSAFTAMTAIRHAGGLSASIPIFVKIMARRAFAPLVFAAGATTGGCRQARKKNGDLSVENTERSGDMRAGKEYEIAMLLVTKRCRRVVVCYRGQVHHFAGMSVNCVDSTGAGDAFVAGLLTGLSYGIIYR